MVHKKINFFLSVLLVLLFGTLSSSCLANTNLSVTEFRNLMNEAGINIDSIEIPTSVQNILTTEYPVIIKSEDNNYVYIYPTKTIEANLRAAYSMFTNWSFFTTGSGVNTQYLFSYNCLSSTASMVNGTLIYSKPCYIYDVLNNVFITKTWIYTHDGYAHNRAQPGALFGLTMSENETVTDFKNISTLKRFLNKNLIFNGQNYLYYNNQNVLYKFNGVYAGDNRYTSSFTTNTDMYRFTYQAYNTSENYDVVNYFYLQKFAPNEAIKLTNSDLSVSNNEIDLQFNRNRTRDFSFNGLINLMEQGYIYRIYAFSNQHNSSGDLIRSANATSQFFSLNSWNSSEIEVLNIYDILFTDNPDIEQEGGGSSGGGDLPGIEQGVIDINNNLTNVPDISGTVISSGDITDALNFEFMEDPYSNFWLELNTGLGNALTNNIRTLDINWFGYNYTINLDNFVFKYPPALESILTSVSTVAIVWVLVKWWKIIVDEISSGNIDEVLAMNEESGIIDLF